MALKSTGYQVAPIVVTWSGQGVNDLADNEYTDLSDAIDNGTTKYKTVDVRIALASAAFNGNDSLIQLFIAASVDGSNYPTWKGAVTTDEAVNMNCYEDYVMTSGATEAQELVIRDVPVPPGLYKIGLRSRANVLLANTGNTVEIRPHSSEDS